MTVRTRSTRLARWALLRLEDRVTPTLNIWTGGAGDGLWSSDNNWTEFHAPTAGDDAIINSNVTVTHNAGDDTVHSLAISTGATFNLTGGSIIDANSLDAPVGDSHFNLAGGTLAGATVSTGSIVFATTSGGTLNGVTLAGTLDLTSSVSARVVGGLTLNGGTVLLGSDTGNFGVLSFDGGSQSLGGTGTVVFGTSFYDFLQAGPTAGSALTIGPNVLVHGATGGVGYHAGWGGPTGVTFTNQGTIQADTAGGTITLYGTDWTNTGTLRAAGGTLATAGSWTNSGTVTSAGDPGAVAVVTEAGNTVTVTTAAAHGYAVGQSVVISGVGNTGYNGTFTITGVPSPTSFTYAHFATGLPDSGGGTATLNSTVNLGGTYATATLGTVTSSGGTVNITGTLDNTGHTLALDAGTGSWQLLGGTITGGTVTTADGAALVGTTSGGTLAGVTLAGSLDIGAQNAALARVTSGLTLNGGTVLLGSASGNYGLLEFDGGDQTLGGSGSVVFGASIYDFLRAGPTAGSNLTIGPDVTVRGNTGSIGYSVYWGGPTDVTVTNQGTVQADTAGGTISLGGKNWSNTGTLRATAGGSLILFSQDFGWTSSTPVSIDGGGMLRLGGTGWTTAGVILTNSTVNLGSAYNVPGTFAFASLGTLTRTGGTVNLTGTLDNTNSTLALDATTGPWQLSGGTILGGTVTTAGANTLIGTTNGGKLSGVTLAGTLDLGTNSGSFATVAGGLTLDGGTVLIGSDTGNYGRLEFDGGNQTLGGTGTVVFGTSIYDFLRAGPTSGSALTIGPGVTVRGHTGSVGYSIYWGGATDVTVTNQGTIDADTAGGAISVMNDTNFAGGTLTGGTWESTAGVLRLVGQNITTSAATILLDGPNAGIFSDTGTTDALAALAANAVGGSLMVNDRAFAATGAFINAGTLTVGPGGILTLPAGAAIDIQGGLLEGTGTIAADVTNSGTVDPGPGLGVLTVIGNYTQTAAGNLAVEIGGTGQADRLDLGAAVGLGGTLAVTFVNGYFPPVGSGFTVLTTAGGTGGSTFAGLAEGGHFDVGPTTFRVTYAGGDGNDVALTAINRAPTLVTDPLTVLPPVPVRTKPTDVPAGMLVADLIAGKTTDADGDPVGIAITGLDPANTITKSVPKFGVWQFTTDGTTWNPIPLDVSASKVLVLSADATTRVRFLPNLKFQGLSHLTFLAWDHTDGATAGTTADSTAAPTSYSTAAERAWVAVGKSKPAVTAAGATVLTAVREDAKGSRVFTVKALLGLAGLESLPATNLGIAITDLSTTTGTWQYRLAKTKTFVAIDPTISPTHALLLRPTDTVQFVPAANANGTGSLQFKTWVPDANFGTYATDTTGAAFGRDSGAASISITPVNDAPVVDPGLHPTLGTVPAGQTTAPITIAALLATAPGVVTDIDSIGLGVLLMPASSKVGKWQYFDTVANAWKNLTVAKKLAADVQVRFQAAVGAAAGPISLAFKAWDGKLLSKEVGSLTVTIG